MGKSFKRSKFFGSKLSKIKNQTKSLFNIFNLPTKNDWTSFLPDEILIKIFNYLPKISLLNISPVCQRWNQIMSDKILWRGVDMSRKLVLFSNLTSILCKGVVALKMVGTKMHHQLSTKDILVPAGGHQLTMLDMTMASISSNMLCAVLLPCTNLEKLSLESCTLNDDICRDLGAKRNLEVLNISMCKRVNTKFISHLSRLEELNVSGIKLDHANIVHLVLHLPATLKRLSISRGFQSLNDEDVVAVCSSCPDLIELNVSLNNRLTDLSIDVVLRCLPRLQHLSISGCFRITLLKLAELASLSSLETLNIHRTFKDSKVEILSELLGGVQVNKSFFSTVARSDSQGKDTIWGYPTEKF